MISAALDYLPVSFKDYLYHLIVPFNIKRPSNYLKEQDVHQLLGYSCRSLFDTIMRYYSERNNNLKILTTPIHHTSFRNIIEKYVKPENVFILDVNERYNSITGIPNYDVDLCVITHLFGQDMNCNFIKEHIDNFPFRTIFIEDRVQGGSFDSKFSNNFMDISLYSTGMDKKPCGLGGGVAFIKDINTYEKELCNLVTYSKIAIDNYIGEFFWHRIWFIMKKFPTFLLYNCKWFISLILWIFSVFKIDLHSFASKYRKSNRGFEHNDFNRNPSNGTLTSIRNALLPINYKKIEELYTEKSTLFFSKLKANTKYKMFLWNTNDKPLLTPYNTMSVQNREQFIDYFNNLNIPIIENPTYKTFNFPHTNKEQYENFNNTLVYLPSLAIMTDTEITYLAILLNNYYSKNK